MADVCYRSLITLQLRSMIVAIDLGRDRQDGAITTSTKAARAGRRSFDHTSILYHRIRGRAIYRRDPGQT
jgi:hypothetical protein